MWINILQKRKQDIFQQKSHIQYVPLFSANLWAVKSISETQFRILVDSMPQYYLHIIWSWHPCLWIDICQMWRVQCPGWQKASFPACHSNSSDRSLFEMALTAMRSKGRLHCGYPVQPEVFKYRFTSICGTLPLRVDCDKTSLPISRSKRIQRAIFCCSHVSIKRTHSTATFQTQTIETREVLCLYKASAYMLLFVKPKFS